MILNTLSGPIIGAVIGYCTNYIAVKMLFYPRKEIRIWGHRLPFTPGAIPKGKPRLAKAIGNIVANTLLTEEDIKEKILSPEIENAVVEKMTDALSLDIRSGMEKLLPAGTDYEGLKKRIADVLTEQVLEAVQRIDIGNTIAEEGKKAVKEKTKGTMLEMFLTDELLASFIQPMGEEIVKFIDENGKDYIEPEILSKIDSLEEKSVLELCDEMNVGRETVHQMMVSAYHTAAAAAAANMGGQFNIAKIIEDKITDMSVEELEKMVLSVMKKELNTIVSLGALVGGLLGILNMLF